LAAFLAAAIFISSGPAHAVSIGTLVVGTPYADVIQSGSGNFNRQYDFHLNGGTQLTLLASSQAQTSDHFKVDALTISLFDASNVLLATASGIPLAAFDSFDQTGVSLLSGDYIVRVFGHAPAGFNTFVKVSLAANDFVAQTPIPGAALMLLTALGGLGGIGALRKYRATSQSTALAA